MAHDTFEETEYPRPTPAVHWLIGLCVAVFFVQETILLPDIMARWLGYTASNLASHALWTVVTYMFVHANVMHLLLNMLTLWMFGRRVEQSWGSTTFTWYYLWCGLGGWFFHYMFANGSSVLVGASAAILGVAVAYAVRWPDDEILLFAIVPMKVKWAIALMAGINVVMAVIAHGSLSGTAFAAHVGGMVAGYIYLRTPTAQSLDRFRRRIAPAPDYGDDPPRAVPKSTGSRPRERDVDDIVAQSKAAIARVRPAAPASQPSGQPTPAATSPLDAVLDKIAATGMGSLTAAEKAVLDEMSRKLRDR